ENVVRNRSARGESGASSQGKRCSARTHTSAVNHVIQGHHIVGGLRCGRSVCLKHLAASQTARTSAGGSHRSARRIHQCVSNAFHAAIVISVAFKPEIRWGN